VVLAFVVLIPNQGTTALGWELVVGGVGLEGYGVRLQAQTVAGLPVGQRGQWAARLVPLHLATLAVLVAGVSVLLGQGGGLL